jgi:hypothetical protein
LVTIRAANHHRLLGDFKGIVPFLTANGTCDRWACYRMVINPPMHDFVRGCGASTEGCVSLPRPPGSNFSCVKLRQHHVDFDCRSGVARRCALFTHIFHSSIRLMRDRFALTQRGPSEVLGTRLQSQSGSSKMSRDNRRLNNHRTFVQLQGAISHVPVVEWRRGRLRSS